MHVCAVCNSYHMFTCLSDRPVRMPLTRCAHAVAILHSAVPYLKCHEAHLYDQYVFLLYSDTMDDDMRFLTPLLDRFAKTSPECSGNGTLDQETGTCHCKMGFLGDACDIVAFDGID